MECTEKNLDFLFSNAVKMDPEDLDASFKALMKDGEKSIEQSGKNLKKILNYHFFKLLF